MLKELTLRNFRCHRSLTVKFGPGINGIVGENGAGKSSILEAIQFAMIGEGNKPKDQMVTSGSIGQSYVRLTFELNGKEGIIERHLNASKVTLSYDGKTYVKAGEVKELWASLLQIDPHILKHIIIAHQKKIPELLNADSTVREKAFQKVFLVPPTEQLRTLIWDRYIKACPPPYTVEDNVSLNGRILELQATLMPVTDKIEKLGNALLTEAQLRSVATTLNHLDACIRDAEAKPKLQTKIGHLRQTIDSLDQRIAQLSQEAAQYNKVELDLRKTELLKKGTTLKFREGLLAKLEYTYGRISLTDDEVVELTSKQATLKSDIQHLENNKAVYEHELKSLNGHSHISKSAESTCPTCRQPIPPELIKEMGKQVTKLTQLLVDVRTQLPALYLELEKLNNMLAEHSRYIQTLDEIVAQLTTIDASLAGQDLTNPDEELRNIEVALTELASLQSTISQSKLTQVRNEAELTRTQDQITRLNEYSGTTSAAEEHSMMLEILQLDNTRRSEVVQLREMSASLQAEIKMYQSKLELSDINKRKNDVRDAYLAKLQKVYDTLHSSEFPRKLIQTYAGDVEAALTEKLQLFSLPYRVKIGEGFKIEIYDTEDRLIPDLSGGQEMVVGICLRLALHSMFSQSFPLLIIDEGTTHLSESRRQMYFECIKTLKTTSELSQVIIIDHDPGIMDVVDHVISV